MNEEFDILNDETEIEETRELDFNCPNCGEIHQDDVVFLCNKCEAKDMIKRWCLYLSTMFDSRRKLYVYVLRFYSSKA